MQHKPSAKWLLERPRVTAAAALEIAMTNYDVSGVVRELGSQQDRNYLVQGTAGADPLLLKIYNPVVTRETVELQITAADRLREHGLRTPLARPSLTGERLLTVPLADSDSAATGENATTGESAATGGNAGAGHSTATAVGFEVVPGRSLLERGELDGVTAEMLGAQLGRVLLALQDFDHPAARRELQWDLCRADQVVAQLLEELPADKQPLCRDATIAAWQRVSELAAKLPRQIIHGDLTADNVMQDDSGNLWVVDLGDLMHSWRVNELAVFAADLLGHTGDFMTVLRGVAGCAKQLAAAGNPLSVEEVRAILPLIVLRGAVLAVSGYSQLRIDPENEYAAVRMEQEWQVFERSLALPYDWATAQLLLAAGLPHTGADYAYAILGIDEAKMLDLGITSPVFNGGSWLAKPAPEQEAELAADLVQFGEVCVARFGEARMTRVSGDTTEQGRARARGVQLWQASESRIRAPFAGEVYCYNAGESSCITLYDREHGVAVTFASEVLKPIDSAKDFVTDIFGEDEPLGEAEPLAENESEREGQVEDENEREAETGPNGEGFSEIATPVKRVVAGEVIGLLSSGEDEILGSAIVTRQIVSPEATISDLIATIKDNVSRGTYGFTDAAGDYESNCAADPSVVLRLPARAAAVTDPHRQKREAQTRRNSAMGEAAERYYADPPLFLRGWEALLIDNCGNSYVDLVNNVTAIGHSNPVLAERVAEQLQLLNTNNRFLYDAYAEFTEKLLAHSPDPRLNRAIPVNSGSEAVDLAIRLAQVATGRSHIIATREGYHGWTMASDAVSTSAFDNPHATASRPDWVHLVSAPNSYRGEHQGEDAAEQYAAEVERVIAEMVAAGNPPAAFICEPVFGNAGGVIPPAGYLDRVYRAVREAGGLVIADEVQVGYGRLGKTFWGCELLGVTPDIIATAKAAGNAYPVGAVIASSATVAALVRVGMFFSSAAGAPASAVAASAVLDEIESRQLQANALTVGNHIRELLAELQNKHEVIGAVHGSGLYLGIELVTDRDSKTPATTLTAAVCEALLAEGFIVQPTSERQNVLKFKPPMVLTIEQASQFVNALDRVLTGLTAS